MSFWDNMKRFTSSYGEEDFDEEEEFEGDTYEEEAPPQRNNRRNAEPASTGNTASGKTETASFNGRVLNMNNSKASVVLFRPTCSNDATQAADDLRDKKAVIVNMENVDAVVARRVVDFLSGCAYALEGKVMKIAQATYLFCPNSMDVSGDLEVTPADAETNA